MSATQDAVEMVNEFHTRAEEIGIKDGANSAEWFIQDLWGGRVTKGHKETAEAFLRGYDDGDPAVMDKFTLPNLSGEWAGDETPSTLFARVVRSSVRKDMDDDDKIDLMHDLADYWDNGVQIGFWDTLVKSAQSVLAE
jgi:hypothetical protein